MVDIIKSHNDASVSHYFYIGLISDCMSLVQFFEEAHISHIGTIARTFWLKMDLVFWAHLIYVLVLLLVFCISF